MKLKDANKFIEKLGMGDPTTCAYQFLYDEKHSVNTKRIQDFIMYGLGLCIKVDSYVAHMFYAWSLSHNTEVQISLNNNKYFLYLNTNTNVFTLEAGNSNKNLT